MKNTRRNIMRLRKIMILILFSIIYSIGCITL